MKRKIIIDVCYHCPYVVHHVISENFRCRKMKVDFVAGFDITANIHDGCTLPYAEEPTRDEREG